MIRMTQTMIVTAMFAVAGNAQETLKSSFQPGDRVKYINVFNVTGPFAGEVKDLVRFADFPRRPLVVILAREPSPSLTKLLLRIDAHAVKESVVNLVVFLGDDVRLRKQLKAYAKCQGFKNVILSTNYSNVLRFYNVSERADVTVLLCKALQNN